MQKKNVVVIGCGNPLAQTKTILNSYTFDVEVIEAPTAQELISVCYSDVYVDLLVFADYDLNKLKTIALAMEFTPSRLRPDALALYLPDKDKNGVEDLKMIGRIHTYMRVFSAMYIDTKFISHDEETYALSLKDRLSDECITRNVWNIDFTGKQRLAPEIALRAMEKSG